MRVWGKKRETTGFQASGIQSSVVSKRQGGTHNLKTGFHTESVRTQASAASEHAGSLQLASYRLERGQGPLGADFQLGFNWSGK